MEIIISQILKALTNSVMALGMLLGPLSIAGILLHLIERQMTLNFMKSIGWKGVLFTAWIGTPIHEIGHAIFCILFRHKINKISFFQPSNRSGTLGFVEHAYNKKSFYQRIGNFFIGIAPIFAGTVVLYLLLKYLLPHGGVFFVSLYENIEKVSQNNKIESLFSSALKSLVSLSHLLFKTENLIDYKFWIFLYLSLCVSSHIAPSREDMKGTITGFSFFVTIVVILSLVDIFFKLNLFAKITLFRDYFYFSIAILTYAVIIAFLSFVVTGILLFIYRKLLGKR